ncbi:hypothetical protein Tco_0581347 [Tanacetum coccineum]
MAVAAWFKAIRPPMLALDDMTMGDHMKYTQGVDGHSVRQLKKCVEAIERLHRNKNVDTTPRYKNDNQTGQFGNQRVVNVAGARETVGGQVVQQSGIQCFNCKEFGKVYQLQAEQSDWDRRQDEEILDVACENNKIQKQLNEGKCNIDSKELNLSANLFLRNLVETLGESNSIRDSCLVALKNKQTEFERYKAFNDRTVDYDKLERKLNETLGPLTQKEIDIKEGLKVKAYEISVVKEKHDELVKQSLLIKSHYEGLV